MNIKFLKAYCLLMKYALRVGFKTGKITKVWNQKYRILRIDLRTFSRLSHGVGLSKKQLGEVDAYWHFTLRKQVCFLLCIYQTQFISFTSTNSTTVGKPQGILTTRVFTPTCSMA